MYADDIHLTFASNDFAHQEENMNVPFETLLYIYNALVQPNFDFSL